MKSRSKLKNQKSKYSKSERYHVYERAQHQCKEMGMKNEKKKNWFKKNNNCEAVMFVPTTPDEKLAKS